MKKKNKEIVVEKDNKTFYDIIEEDDIAFFNHMINREAAICYYLKHLKMKYGNEGFWNDFMRELHKDVFDTKLILEKRLEFVKSKQGLK